MRSLRRSLVVALAVSLPLSALALPTRARAVGSIPVLVSRATTATGIKGTGPSPPPSFPPFDLFMPSVSANGQFVVFTSAANNLDGADGDTATDVYVRDLQNNTTELISRSTGGKGNGASYTYQQAISADGRYVVFVSEATNLDVADVDPGADVYLRDRQFNTTTLLSRVGPAGAKGNSASIEASISSDGSHVAFTSFANNLAAGDPDFTQDIIVRDLGSSANTLVSRAEGLAGTKSLNGGLGPKLSATGQFVTFYAQSPGLDGADPGTNYQVYLRDVTGGHTTLISRQTGVSGTVANAFSSNGWVSDDGQIVTYSSQAMNLDPADTDPSTDVFQRNVGASTTTLISRANGVAGAKQSSGVGVLSHAASSDGRFVAFSTDASNLDPFDNSDGFVDAYLRDTQASATTLISRAGASGPKGDDNSNVSGLTPDASTLVMASQATNLDPDDTDNTFDTYAFTEAAPPPPPPPPPPPLPPGGSGPGGSGAPDSSGGAGESAGSNDPNPTNNPGPSDPAANTPTAPCSGACSAGVTGQEATMVVAATNTAGGGGSAMELPERRSTTLFAELNGGGMPQCPGHQPLYHEWVRFGFKEKGAGGTYRKTVTITSRHGYTLHYAGALLRKQQVCFEAPYRFAARPGYGTAHRGGDWSAVLPECRAHTAGPCVIRRHLIKGVAGKWYVQLVFRVPPSAKDPKALG